MLIHDLLNLMHHDARMLFEGLVIQPLVSSIRNEVISSCRQHVCLSGKMALSWQWLHWRVESYLNETQSNISLKSTELLRLKLRLAMWFWCLTKQDIAKKKS